MPTLSAMQIYNKLTTGTLDATGLQTVITTGGKLPSFQELRGEPQYARGLLSVDSSWNAIRGSDALGHFTSNPISIRNLFGNTPRLTSLLSSVVDMKRAVSNSYANQQFIPYYSFANRMVTRASPFGTTQMNGIAHSGSMYVAVGTSGTVYSSPDGETWTKRTYPTTDTINSVAFGNGFFIGVGSNGIRATSSDGITWSNATSFGSDTMNFIVFAGNQFIAVGYAGSIYTSANGSTFTKRTSPNTTATFTHVAYSGTRYMISANDWTSVATSDDGITWTGRSVGFNVRSVAYGNGLFVVNGPSDNISTSPDGVTWTYRTPPETGWSYSDHLTFVNGRFIMPTVSRGTYTSTDGITWTIGVGPINTVGYKLVFANNKITGVGATGLLIQADNQFSNLRYFINTADAKGMMTSGVRTLKFINGKFFACGSDGMSTSTDGFTWYKVLGAPVVSIAFGNGTYVAIQSGSTNVFTSTDLTTWTQRATNFTGGSGLADIAYGAGNFVVISALNFSIRSTNGTTWVSNSAPMASANRLIFVNDTFVAVGGSAALSTSPDGISWTARTSGQVSAALHDITYAEGRYIYVADWYATAPTGNYGYTTDLTASWTRGNLGNSSLNFKSIAYGNGVYVAQTSTGLMYVGADITNSASFVVRPSSSSTSDPGVAAQSIVFADNIFVSVKSNDIFGQTNY